ncbi:Ig-like domain-containing protein [Bradyrhizobium sp. WSM2254]|uniref:Ig-like domain-containing protein n=1 Tax=Bradyrhizobium sp. WSM2254 TaxID=1188263 RepID=UPI000423BF88|nr:Ig-like domain-containing protein [Bradyrhizobium sp. WSM2254]
MGISLSELIKQNTLGQSEGYPAGVPHSYSWYKGWNPGGQMTPPAGFTAVEGWGQVYTEEGAPASPGADVEVANAKTYVHIKETGQWVLVQDQSKLGIGGGHFVSDFAGNSAYPMTVTRLSNGAANFDAPSAGYNDHFWYGSRGTYAAGTVDGVYVQMDMRTTDANAKLVGMVGVDWWRNATAPFLADHSNNPGVGGSNWVELSTQWKTVGYYSLSTAAFQADLPPPLLGSSPPVEPSDTVAPASPTIVALTPDTGTAGDNVTNAKQLTLSGTAEAGSTIKVFEGTTVIGTAKASASGTWSLTTAQLPDGNHAFTATATDAAGNVSSKSASRSILVDTLAPVAPRITAFTPDSGTVAAKTTNTGQLTLSGTAEAGSTVKVVEGTTVIGTTKADAGGAWSLTTAQLAAGNHAFAAMATDAAGNVSTKSAALNVTVSAPVTSPPATGNNLLVNGSFEATSLAPFAGGRWGAYKSVSGWTAISGGTIELWNNLGGVKASDGGNFGELDYAGARDGFYQDVKTVAGQAYQLSFDARSRPGFTGATCSIEVLWNGSVIATVPPSSSWDTFDFKVVGTGSNDRLTFREVASQGSDGLGALYDNIQLTVATATPADSLPGAADKNLLVNGSFESSALAPLQAGRWGAFDAIPGWHAISGGTIELWNNLNGVKASDGGNYGELDYAGARDGLYQDVETVAGQQYVLSFDARSRPGFTSSTCSIEVLWNGSVLGVVPPDSTWQNYDFTVTGTGGQDRVTFREVTSQGSDGLGALYDNVSLVAKPASSASASLLSSANQAFALLSQYTATDATTAGAVTNGPLAVDPNASLVQTLSLPAQH